MKLTASCMLYGLGAILLLALTICSRKFSGTGEPSFIIALSVAGVAYLLAIRELLSPPRFPNRVIIFELALAAVWHVLLLRMPSGFGRAIRSVRSRSAGRHRPSRITLPGNHDCGAGAAEFGQIASGGDVDLEPWALPSNNRAVKVRLR